MYAITMLHSQMFTDLFFVTASEEMCVQNSMNGFFFFLFFIT